MTNRETVELFEILLELLQSKLEIDLLREENGEFFLHEHVHVFVAGRFTRVIELHNGATSKCYHASLCSLMKVHWPIVSESVFY